MRETPLSSWQYYNNIAQHIVQTYGASHKILNKRLNISVVFERDFTQILKTVPLKFAAHFTRFFAMGKLSLQIRRRQFAGILCKCRAPFFAPGDQQKLEENF